jgi:CO/xanthine dehydrogenase Mo-binding subunit
MAMGAFGAAVGRSSAVIHVDSKGEYELHVGVTDVGTAAKTTMALIAAEELGVPLAQGAVVSGDTEVCPYSVGESGSRTTTHTGYAVVQAAKDLKQQIADKGMPEGDEIRTGSATPDPAQPKDSARYASRRISRKWKWTPSSATFAW